LFCNPECLVQGYYSRFYVITHQTYLGSGDSFINAVFRFLLFDEPLWTSSASVLKCYTAPSFL
jgi:hypothetical protein